MANFGLKVYGVDINQKVVDTINQGRVHIVEPDLAEVVRTAVTKGMLIADTKPKEADIYLIVVPTPFKEGHVPDTSYVESATDSIIPLLKEGDLYIIESTSPVGTTEQMAQWLAEAELDDITHVIKKLGEEKFGKRIAHKILEVREHTPITTTKQLADLVDEAVPVKDKFKHPATRTFQAIRIYINSELEEIQTALQAAIKVLKPGGRLVVISFHSLEDRIVKRFMRDLVKGPAIPRGVPVMHAQVASKFRLTGKAMKPSAGEVEAKPRARSAVMRILERVVK